MRRLEFVAAVFTVQLACSGSSTSNGSTHTLSSVPFGPADVMLPGFVDGDLADEVTFTFDAPFLQAFTLTADGVDDGCAFGEACTVPIDVDIRSTDDGVVPVVRGRCTITADDVALGETVVDGASVSLSE